MIHTTFLFSSMPPHPNVVMFRGVTLPPDPVTLVTDFCDEGSLLGALKANNFSLEKKLGLIADIAKGMVCSRFDPVFVAVVLRCLFYNYSCNLPLAS